MSRFSDYDGEEFYPNQADLWYANVKRALAGKRGKRDLAELREALRALPEKRLISGALCTVGAAKRIEGERDPWGYLKADVEDKVSRDGEGVCAIGAYLWFKKVKAGADPRAAFEELPMLLDFEGDSDYMTAVEAQRSGMTFTLASTLAYKNDMTFEGMTPEARYEAFMRWLDEQLGDVAA